MTVSKRVIAIQTSKIDARLAATRRQGSVDAFRLQLASLGEALAANASPDVALEYLREAKANALPKVSQPVICAVMDSKVYKPLNKIKVQR